MFKPQLNKLTGKPDHSQTWIPDWNGPFVVVGRKHDINSDVYILKDNTTAREWTVNVNKLRPYNARRFVTETAIELPETPDAIGVSSDEVIPLMEPSQSQSTGLRSAVSDVGTPLRNLSSTTSEAVQIPKMHKSTIRKVQFQIPKVHKSFTRHVTGRTKQEHVRENKRKEFDNSNDEVNSDHFNEKEIDVIIDYRKKGRRFEYLTSWKHTDIKSWLTEDEFFTKDCLYEFWATRTSKERPRKYIHASIDEEGNNNTTSPSPRSRLSGRR